MVIEGILIDTSLIHQILDSVRILFVHSQQDQHLIGSSLQDILTTKGLLAGTLEVDFSRTFVEEPEDLSLLISRSILLGELIDDTSEGSREDNLFQFVSLKRPGDGVKNVNLKNIRLDGILVVLFVCFNIS